MEDVKLFFEQPRYANCPDEVKRYARWALLPDGPAFHETPTPMTCNVERDHENYIVSLIPSQLLTRILQFFFSNQRVHFNRLLYGRLRSISFLRRRDQFCIPLSVHQIHQKASMHFCLFL